MSKQGSKTLDDLLVSGKPAGRKVAATVSGDQVVMKEEKGEIYIRADGKKVRKVKKTVIKKKKKSGEDGSSDPIADTKKPAQDIDDDDASLVSYMSQGVKKKKKKSKKTKDLPSEAAAIATSAEAVQSSAAAKDDDDGSVVSYMSASGVRKKKKKSKKILLSDAGAIAMEAEAISTEASPSLATEDDDDTSVVSYMSASGTKRKKKKKKKKEESAAEAIATEAEAAASAHIASVVNSADDDDDDRSLVSYMSTSGIKRKKKKSKKKMEGASAEDIAANAEAKDDDDQSIVSYMSASGVRRKKKKSEKNLDGFLNQGTKKSKKDGSVTSKKKKDDASVRSKTSKQAKVAKSVGSGEGEIYINKDGKKVRRVKKTKSTDDIPNSLSGVLGAASSRVSGPATVAGDRVIETSEIYINKDGKKVRRVKKTITRAKQSDEANAAVDLGKLLDSGTAGKVGAATVSGASAGEGEIYINKDGKKVRRVKKSVATSTTSLGELLDGSASTTTAGAASFAGDGEIYVRADGKKVRRVKKPTNGASASLSGTAMSVGGDEIYINAEGKKVRRVRKSVAEGSSTTTADTSGTKSIEPASIVNASVNARGLLDGIPNESSTPKIIGAATVAAPQSRDSEQSEIYINKDGKKVRRVKKTQLSEKADLGKLLDNQSKPGASGGATVGGSAEEGEIYIRADGKKVRRVKRAPAKSEASNLNNFLGGEQTIARGAATVGGDGGEIRIRADGKKVIRRVKKKEQQDDEVFHRRSDGVLVRRVKKQAPTVKLTDDEEKIATEYRKMKKMGLPDDAVRHKMTVSDVHPKIIAAVFGEKWVDPALTPSTEVVQPPTQVHHLSTNVQLTGGEEALAIQYRKLMSLGLPHDEVRAKMLSHGVDQKIIAAVFNEEWTQTSAPDPVAINLVKIPAVEVPVKSAVNQSESIGDEIVLTKVRTEQAVQIKPDAKLGSSQIPTINQTLPSSDEIVLSTVRKEQVADSTGTKAESQSKPIIIKSDSSGDEIILTAVRKEQPAEVAVSQSVLTDNKSSPESLTREELVVAAKFQSMIRGGMPEHVVRQKMEASELDLKIMEFVIGKHVGAKDISSDSNVTIANPPEKLPSTQVMASSIQLNDGEESIAQHYRKMLKMGLPNDVVRHKMTSEDVHPKIMAAVLGEEWIDTSVSEMPLNIIPTPVPSVQEQGSVPMDAHDLSLSTTNPATQADAISSPATQSNVPVLSESEEVDAAQYRKMLKMGLPPDVVRHKMIAMETTPKIMAAVLGEPLNDPSEPPTPPATQSDVPVLDESEDADAAQYRKMLKMGLPPDVVRHKMTAMEAHPKIMAAVLGEPWSDQLSTPTPPALKPDVESSSATQSNVPALSESEEADAAQYRKMLKMGLPPDVVRHKMTAMEAHPKIMAAVLGEPWSEPSAAPTPPAQQPDAVPVPSTQSSVPALNESEEADAAQYRKMLKMGLPPDVVRHKMTAMEAHPKIMAAVLGEPWSDPSAAATPPAQQIDAVPVPSTQSNVPVLNESEEADAAQYRKMLKMGLPSDVVRHKMTAMEAHPKIMAAVLGEPWSDPSAPPTPPAPESSLSLPAGQLRPLDTNTAVDGSMAFIVVVGDDQMKAQAAAKAMEDIHLNPDERFAVKVAEGAAGTSSTAPKTKFITLAELAKMSGQSQSELEAIVKERKQRSASPPRFVLQSLVEEKFEVEIPDGVKGTPINTVESTSAPNSSKPKAPPPPANSEIEDLINSAIASGAGGGGDMTALLEKLRAGLREAEKRQKKLEKQLAQAGVAIAEDIDYAEAKAMVERIAKRMGEIGGSDVVAADKNEQNKLREEYFKLEQEMERYNTALTMSEEYQAEQERLEKKWEDDNLEANIKALKQIRRHMPVMVRHMSEADLANKPSPNGKYLPKAIAKKFKRTNVLQCLRINPADIERMHPSTVENMRVTGLTLTERRAVYAHLKPIGPKWEKNKAEKMTERKWTWFTMMKNNFKENVDPYTRHCQQYGPPENHPYATRDNPNVGCPLLGKQCPVRADKEYDYSGDYGYPDGDEYEVSDVKKSDADDPGAKAMAEAAELARHKKANERADILKKHYNGKLLQVSKANGSCESMDEAMDRIENHTIKWIEFMISKGGKDELEADKKKEIANFTDALNELKLSTIDFATRSGMQMSGKKKAGGDAVDIRSSVEACLSEETFECTREFFKFIKDRMKEIDMIDTRIEKTIDLLDALWNELHEKNVALLAALGTKKSNRSRKFKKNSDLRKEVEDKIKPPEEAAPEEEAHSAPRGPPGPMGGGGRGGLLDAISGRGRGGGDAGGGGRGGLLDAIAGRGRGRGDAGGGGRGGLLDAIKGGRGKGRGGGGGRGDLLSAIAGRGRGGGDGGGGGRGGLLAAIAARGGGG